MGELPRHICNTPSAKAAGDDPKTAERELRDAGGIAKPNWPYDWRRDREAVRDFNPPAPPRPPAIVGRGRGRALDDVAAAALEARRNLEREGAAE